MSEQWTIKKMLEWTSDYFSQKSIETPRLEAEILLCHVLGLRRIDLYLQFEKPLSQDELKSFKALIKRRLDNEPVAYLVGKKEFWSRDFFVSSDVLIPRPDSEHLIEVVLDHIKTLPKEKRESPMRAFELGLGSGCLSITLLNELPQLSVVGLDYSAEALAVARKNAEYHGVDARLHFEQGDFLKSDFWDASYDVVVSNPPYVSETEFNDLSATVKDHEPRLALVADDNGLAFYPKIATFAKKNLNENGVVVVEIGESQGMAVKKFFEDAGFSDVLVKKDLAGHDRAVFAIQKP
ncbi:MAG: peptide chain release factor N(5)-glutamine methyltransferase [Deltaproteobacteria bacterium]|nr:peptide chain release factor N(5)-glutamine methyltransferase [Deltaproteobacteria bacterium]